MEVGNTMSNNNNNNNNNNNDKIALRRFTNIVKCRIVLHEHRTHTYLHMKYLYDEYAARKRLVLPSSWSLTGFTLPDG